ncbi:hypothetical protein DFQ14_101443 [Halopolyspora algeriensis]|uniref:Uncharacterized protein n=1 Tax=Halopolyspora algeriensis TaxID=1500506 RepID=A0A368W099_9ACTN|nr:hypothetical protein [Halopolyspora algeriensis]RCW47099.1 hypothetical protein DFQ14_101443 [Halopolyspora algeriensis]TQM48186.1 hypothetical protein FHU43_3148 [Halopolyspora algeriensis]
MNERELEELFRDAARAAPPASFDEQDISRGARRVTARRRMATAGSSLAVAAVLVGGLGAGTGMFTPDESTQAGPTPGGVRQPSQEQPPRTGPNGTGPTVLGGPLTGQGSCGPPDRELADALAQQLPEATRATTPVAATSCPTGSRTASFQVRQGATAGNVTVLLAPAESVPPEQRRSGEHRRPDGTRQVTDEVDGGHILMVRSSPDSGSSAAPYADRLPAIADHLADRF